MKKKKNLQISLQFLLPWLPVVALLIILPFVSSYHVYDSQISSFPWSSGTEQVADIALYCKQHFFTLLTGCFLLLFMWQLYKNKKELHTDFRKQWHMMIPAASYLLLAFLSSVCSEYRTSAFSGTDEQFESFFCLAGYILAMCSIAWMVQTEKDMKLTLGTLCILAILLGILGLFQYSGNDPFLWEWVQRLITPEGYYETFGSITKTFETGRVTLASYNPNYAGVLLTLLGIFFWGILLTERRPKLLIPEIVILLLLLIALVGTGSKAGLLVFGAVAILAVLFLFKRLLKYWWLVIPICTAVILGSSLAIQYSQLPILENLKAAVTVKKTPENPLQKLSTSQDGIHVNYRGIAFDVSYFVQDDEFHLFITDGQGNDMETLVSETEMTYYLSDPTLADVTIRPTLVAETVYGVTLHLNQRDWTFVSLADGYHYFNHFGLLESLSEVEHLGFTGYEQFASGRGLIWSTTLPLLKEHLLLGAGANNFVFEYPQNDYINMYYYVGTAQVITRPHCMYLQTAVESGIPALLCLLVFFGWYWLESLVVCWKSDYSTLQSRISFACFFAVTAYLVCGLTNDSMITTAPVFWGILGLGIATNRICRRKKEIRV